MQNNLAFVSSDATQPTLRTVSSPTISTLLSLSIGSDFFFIGDADKLLAKIFSSSPGAEENIIVKNLLASIEFQRDPYFAGVRQLLMDHHHNLISNDSRRRRRSLDASSESTGPTASKRVKTEDRSSS